MVATQAITTAALAVLASRLVNRIPAVSPDAKVDAAAKALLGVGLIVASSFVKDGWGKAALIGVGAGIAAGAVAPFVPVL